MNSNVIYLPLQLSVKFTDTKLKAWSCLAVDRLPIKDHSLPLYSKISAIVRCVFPSNPPRYLD